MVEIQHQSSEDPSNEALDEVLEWSPPESARVPEGATFWQGEDDGFCRVIHPGERGRCQGVRMKGVGLCPPHAGRSKILEDPKGMAALGNAGKARVRERRALLASNGITPRIAAREALIRRSDAVVRALVDDPLDDPSLGSRARQRAMLDALDAAFPLSHAEITVEVPADPEGMGWAEMQALAQQLGGAPAE